MLHSPLVVIVAITILIFLLEWADGSTSGGETHFAVFGYLPEYRQGGFDYNGAFQSGVTHLIFFSLEIGSSFLPTAMERLPSREDATKAREHADSVGGKLLLGFGGAGRSDNFAAMVATKSRRSIFLNAVWDILSSYDFDGVDFNWEFPRNAEEWKGWSKLIQEAKSTFQSHGSGSEGSGNRNRDIISFAMHSVTHNFESVSAFGLLQHADYVHAMVYDGRGKHSTLDMAREAIASAKQYLGKDASKWTLGIPFYGRNMHSGEATPYYDIAAKVKARRKSSKDIFGQIFFNSQQTVAKKIVLAKEAGVAGVMIWELGQDVQPFANPRSLLSAVRSALHRPSAPGVEGDEL